MRTARAAGLGLASLAAVALAVGGCSADNAATPGAGTPSGSVPGASASAGVADPAAAAALADAAAKLSTTSFKVSMTSGPGLNLNGLMDAPNGVGTATVAITGSNTKIEIKTLLVDQDLYLQIPGITKTGTWTHVDVSRLPEGANVGLRPGQIDPANTAQLLSSTTDVQRVDPRSFRGTLDLTKVAGVVGVDQKMVSSLGSQAQNVPFTAGLDEQGRLSALTIQFPAVNGQQAQPLEVLYSDYGTPVDAKRPPAAQIIEAPDSLYPTLGG
ncbi:LolA-like protein [Couchioplanes caeruleus]|uniref:Lipoprotein LprG n=2 Tax=Couchioplanes caeruleus TaxID=56438 RepID=A0A1K0GNK1_9ACTN|nr:LppX_LprAFG lipoprotein [Couchioplanes caeruleus]OJF10779.1 hypothetical protein BG844_30105 [Couchioplanes caeruleus subsp. caeruleus]ROP32248.1 uncharacterized protein DUF1396 [Couchioplanes caeruleus]